MTTLSFPVLSKAAPHRFEWWLSSPSQVSESPFDASEQTLELGAGRWACRVGFDPLLPADDGLLAAFVAQLRGMSGRCYLWHMARPVPRGTINLAGVTLGGNVAAGATTLALAGCGAAKTLLRGDLISVEYELKRVVAADVTADGAGAMATVTVEPPFRDAHTSGTAVVTDQPKAIFRLEGDRHGGGFRPSRNGVLGRIDLAFMESFT